MKCCWCWMDLQDRMPLNRPNNLLHATDVTAIAITKLDGTAKGGVVLAIADQFKSL